MWVWPWESEIEMIVEESIPESSWKFSLPKSSGKADCRRMPKQQEEEGDSEGEGAEGLLRKAVKGKTRSRKPRKLNWISRLPIGRTGKK